MWNREALRTVIRERLGNGICRCLEPTKWRPYLRQLETAARELKELLQINPDDTAAHTNLGTVLEQMGDRMGAIAQYREALRLDPDSADAHNNLGVELIQAEDVSAAIAEFSAAVRLHPDDEELQRNLQDALAEQQRRHDQHLRRNMLRVQ